MKKQKTNKDKQMAMSKRLAIFCLINGVAWVWCSYVLAFLDRMAIAEALSQVAITEIIGVFLVYSVKALFENLSKNNSWPDKSNEIINEEDNTSFDDCK